MNRLENMALIELVIQKKKEKHDLDFIVSNKYYTELNSFLYIILINLILNYLSIETLNRKIDVINERFNKMEFNLNESNKLVINYQEYPKASKKSKKTISKQQINAIKYFQDSNNSKSLQTIVDADPDILSL